MKIQSRQLLKHFNSKMRNLNSEEMDTMDYRHKHTMTMILLVMIIDTNDEDDDVGNRDDGDNDDGEDDAGDNDDGDDDNGEDNDGNDDDDLPRRALEKLREEFRADSESVAHSEAISILRWQPL